jgi:hypothetical protein
MTAELGSIAGNAAVDFNSLFDKMSRIPRFGELVFTPTELADITKMRVFVDHEGIARCVGSDGDTTSLAAVLLNDTEYPVRIPFIHKPKNNDRLTLRIHGTDILGLFVGDRGKTPDGMTRAAIIQTRPSAGSRVVPLASRMEPGMGFTFLEIPYALAMPRDMLDPREIPLAKKMGLFEERLGFDADNTRGIFNVVLNAQKFPIPVTPGMKFLVATRNSTPNSGNIRPDLHSMQSLFRIDVEQLQPSLPKRR